MNARQFIDNLASLGLLSTADLAVIQKSLSAEQLAADAEVVARELVRQAKLTRHQASSVYAGRGKSLVLGDYVVLDKLGAAGNGQLFKARGRATKRLVALKILPPQTTDAEAAAKQFSEQVRAAAIASHPKLSTACEIGEANGGRFLAIEYVDGLETLLAGATTSKTAAVTESSVDDLQSLSAEPAPRRGKTDSTRKATKESGKTAAKKSAKQPAKKSSPGMPLSTLIGTGAALLLIFALVGWLAFKKLHEPAVAEVVAAKTQPETPLVLDAEPAESSAKPAEPAASKPAASKAAVDSAAWKAAESMLDKSKPEEKITAKPAAGELAKSDSTTAKPAEKPAAKAAAPSDEKYMPAEREDLISLDSKPKRVPAPPVAKAPAASPAVASTAAASPTPDKTPPKAGATITTPDALTAPVDLLKLVDLKRDVLAGKWKMDGSSLAKDAAPADAAVQLPFAPPDDYDLTVELDPKSAKNGFIVGLIILSKQASFWTGNAAADGNCLLETTDSKTGNVGRAVPPTQLDKPRSLVCSVRKGRLLARLDGTTIMDADFTESLAKLTPGKHFQPLSNRQLFLGVANKEEEGFHFAKLEIAPPTVVLPTYTRRDLLALIDVEKNVVDGKPELQHGSLLLPAGDTAARLGLPVERPNDYILTLVVERLAGRKELAVGLPFGHSRIAAAVDFGMDFDSGMRNTRAGTERPTDNKPWLSPWQIRTIVCTVERAHVAMTIDGRSVTDSAAGSNRVDVRTPDGTTDVSLPSAFTLAADRDSGFRILRCELTPSGWQPAALPDKAALEAALAAAKSLIAEARTGTKPDEKSTGANKLWQEAESSDDAARRYVLLEAGAHLAAEAGDLALACRMVTGLERFFDGSQRELTDAVILDYFNASKAVKGKQFPTLVVDVLRQIDLAVATEQFDLAMALQAPASVVKPLPPDVGKDLKARGVALAFWKAEQEANDKALAELAGAPTSATAHQTVGRYLALVRGNWDAALEHLDQAGESPLQAAVKAEKTGPRLPDDQLAAGDKWWALTEKAKGDKTEKVSQQFKWACAERAIAWYHRATGMAIGNTLKSVDQRLKAATALRRQSNFAFAPHHPPDATKIGDRWYKVYSAPVHWKTAVAICEGAGGSLPVVKTPDDNKVLVDLLMAGVADDAKDMKLSCWLGCTDEAIEGQFRWLDGSPVGAPTFWKQGRPGSPGDNEDFVALTISRQKGQLTNQWEDQTDAANGAFICVWDH